MAKQYHDNEELLLILSKDEKDYEKLEMDQSFVKPRQGAVDWILKVSARYSFTALTGVLAVNYLDRFVRCGKIEKPWMIQLAAVACVSIAAKMEEVQVPLLLDFQTEESKYYFEAKTIQKMEILVLSTLNWRMNPVTPLSFLDHITRMVGLKHHYLCSEVIRRFERTILCFISESSSVKFSPCVVATAAIMHVINSIQPCLVAEYQTKLINFFQIAEDNVEECYKLIVELEKQSNKRKFGHDPGSPSGVIDAAFSSDSSNDSWSAVSSSMSSSPEPVIKKSRTIANFSPPSMDLQSSIPR